MKKADFLYSTFGSIKFVRIPEVTAMPGMSRSRKHSPMALRFLDALAETTKEIFPSFNKWAELKLFQSLCIGSVNGAQDYTAGPFLNEL